MSVQIVEGTATISDLDSFLRRVQSISEETGTVIQAFDPAYVVSKRHLMRSVELADRAFDRGENVARDQAVEILLYAAGRRQITDALEMGVSESDDPQPIVIVISGKSGSTERLSDIRQAVTQLQDYITNASTLGSYDTTVVDRFYDISESELSVVDGDREAVILERVALLDVNK